MKANLKNAVVAVAVTFALTIVSCDDRFLETKPNSSIVLLSSIDDLWNLLDNSQVMNYTSSLPQLSSDEYFIISDDVFDGLLQETQRGAYIWADNPYGSETSINSWNYPYMGIFYANNVLDALESSRFAKFSKTDRGAVRGSALFMRAYLFFDLLRSFSPAYDPLTADTDLGIPIRLESGVDYVVQRSSVTASYNQIIKDLEAAKDFLPNATSITHLNRPSVCAVYALLARIYLERTQYVLAANYADSALALKNTLLDFNTIDSLSERPFANAFDEVIYYTEQITEYNTTQNSISNQGYIGVDPSLLKLYDPDDLRYPIFFQENSLGNYNVKTGYAMGVYPFTGLAVDELYLIKAEGLVRTGDTKAASQVLDQLLITRYKPGTYRQTTDLKQAELLDRILEERRKELVWRGSRWHDVKRLNKEGRGIHLYRTVHGDEYHLQPNDSRYAFPIPPEEIMLSGLKQNER